MRRPADGTATRVPTNRAASPVAGRHPVGVLPPSVQAFVAQSPVQRGPIARAVADEAARLPEGARVLDAGAGDAPYAALLAHCDHVTQDWPGSVHEGSKAADVIADLHELPLEGATFDAVLCTEVLEHVAEPERALGEIARVLKPGGRVLVTVPFVTELHEEPHDHYRYTSWGLRGLLRRAGFTDVEVVPSTGWFSTVAQLLRHERVATSPDDGRGDPGLGGRLVGTAMLALGELLRRVSPWLDRHLDRRWALPLGWIARARLPEGSGPGEGSAS